MYNFIEFTAKNAPNDIQGIFIFMCNDVLKKEQSAFRFVDQQLTRITSEEEINCIKEAIKQPDKYENVNKHMTAALTFLSDRKKPDYRNSIKESISAVEALVNIIMGEKAPLGKALRKLDQKATIHPAFRDALSNLYGYTSDADGIRHSLLEKTNLTYADAKFMLVTCSAFINYMKEKII